MQPETPRISVIIATRNREELLALALESLAAQTLAAHQFETIVVDNGSSDGTAGRVERMSAGMPGLRLVREERLGLSWARNAGLAAARAPLIAYLDDDARAEPQWLAELIENFEKPVPAPDCVAGPVFLDWNGLPQTVPQKYWSLLSYVNHGGENRPLSEREYLVGANMAFRKEALEAAGGFPVNLGRQGAKLLSGEETQVVTRIRASGGCIYYASQAAVWHRVQPERVQRKWLLRRIFWDGATQPVLDGAAGQPGAHCIRQAYRDAKRIAFFLLHSLGALIGRDWEGCGEGALRAIQRFGRLRTHLLLLFRLAP